MEWVIIFREVGIAPEFFDDEAAAWARFDAVRCSYNCLLYKKIATG